MFAPLDLGLTTDVTGSADPSAANAGPRPAPNIPSTGAVSQARAQGARKGAMALMDIPPTIIIRTSSHGKKSQKLDCKEEKAPEHEYAQRVEDFPLMITQACFWEWIRPGSALARHHAETDGDVAMRSESTASSATDSLLHSLSNPICFYCSHGDFEGPRISMPMQYDAMKNVYHVWGVFCSLNCCKKYAKVTRRVPERQVLPLITQMAHQVYGITDPIVPAPDRELLQMYVGPRGLSIKAFRAASRNEMKLIRILDPPFLWCTLKVGVEPWTLDGDLTAAASASTGTATVGAGAPTNGSAASMTTSYTLSSMATASMMSMASPASSSATSAVPVCSSSSSSGSSSSSTGLGPSVTVGSKKTSATGTPAAAKSTSRKKKPVTPAPAVSASSNNNKKSAPKLSGFYNVF